MTYGRCRRGTRLQRCGVAPRAKWGPTCGYHSGGKSGSKPRVDPCQSREPSYGITFPVVAWLSAGSTRRCSASPPSPTVHEQSGRDCNGCAGVAANGKGRLRVEELGSSRPDGTGGQLRRACAVLNEVRCGTACTRYRAWTAAEQGVAPPVPRWEAPDTYRGGPVLWSGPANQRSTSLRLVRRTTMRSGYSSSSAATLVAVLL